MAVKNWHRGKAMINPIGVSILLIVFMGLGSALTFIVAGWITKLRATNNRLLNTFKAKHKPESYTKLAELSRNLTIIETEALLELLFQHPIRIHKSQGAGRCQIDLVCRSDIGYEEMQLMAEQQSKSRIDYVG